MKSFLKLLFSRVGIVSLGILLQLTMLMASLWWFQDYEPVFHIVTVALSWILVLRLLSVPGNPAYKMAWIILILGVPVFGFFLYAIFGGNRLSKRLRRKMAGIDLGMEQSLSQAPEVLDALTALEPGAAVQARYLINTVHCPVYQGTETEYFSSGEAFFERAMEELRCAQHTIWLEYFIVEPGRIWDRMLEILREKAAAGVDVRLIYDDFGCIRRLPADYPKRLAQWGIQARAFNRFVPLLDSRLNNRDHRKFLLIDGNLGFTGGVNLADEYANLTHPFGEWKDCAIFLRGEAVRSMNAMFCSMWNYVNREEGGCQPPESGTEPAGTGFVQPYLDSPLDDEAVGRTVFSNVVTNACRYVWIMTPYLIIDEAMAETLTNAAKAGIDVRIVTPGIPDKSYVYELTRANYEPLLKGGVRIFEYAPGFVHSKLFLSDDGTAAIGTVNLDFRSLYLHFENGVWLYRADCLREVRADFDRTFPSCREVTLADARRVRLPRRIYRSLLRLLSPLM